MKQRRLSLVKLSAGTSVAALVLTLSCGCPGVVLAQVNGPTPAVEDLFPGGSTTESELPDARMQSSDGRLRPTTSAAVLLDAAADVSSLHNAQAEAAGLVKDQIRSTPPQHEALEAISEDAP